MKNSIMEKFFISYISFAILGFIVITYWSTNMTYDQMVTQKADELYAYDTVLSDNLCENINTSLREIEDFTPYVSDLNNVLDCNVCILSNDFELLYSSDGSTLTSNPSKSIVITSFNPKDYSQSHYKVSNFYNIFKTDMLNVVRSVNKNGNVVGYVMTHMPTLMLKQSSYNITQIFYITYAMILLLSMLIFFNFVWFIYLPLKDIRLAAMEYAKGNFGRPDLKIYSNDEMGDISSSLNYMTNQLQNSREYQTKFISNISHDFRSPLTSIKGYVGAIMDGTIAPEDQNKYLSIVLSEANRLEKLTNGLRDLGSWGNKGSELFLENFDMSNIVLTTIETLEGVANKKNIHLEFISDSKNTVVNADKGKIQQVLYNLIDNAVKFSFANSEIIIKLYDNRGKLYCSVKDSGIGISRNNIDKIWQRFYKADSSRGMDKTGSGIGLSIVREIIRAHGENIDVISTEGVGTTFIFSLPRKKI